MSGQGGWERRIEAFVKIQKKKIFFFLGGGGSGGGGGGGGRRVGGQGGCERRSKVFVKIEKKKKKFEGGGGGSGWWGGSGWGGVRSGVGVGEVRGSKVWVRWVMLGMEDVTSSSRKPLGRSKPNFMWSFLGKGERKFI